MIDRKDRIPEGHPDRLNQASNAFGPVFEFERQVAELAGQGATLNRRDADAVRVAVCVGGIQLSLCVALVMVGGNGQGHRLDFEVAGPNNEAVADDIKQVGRIGSEVRIVIRNGGVHPDVLPKAHGNARGARIVGECQRSSPQAFLGGR